MNHRPHTLEQQLQESLRLDERTGPARRIGREQAHAIVEAALTAAEVAPSSKPWWAGRVLRNAAAALALLGVITGGASAAFWYVERDRATREVGRAAAKAVLPPVADVEREPSARTSDPPAPETSPQTPAGTKHARSRPAPHRAPEDQLQRANRLRAEGKYRAAADAYLLVVERFPGSLSAYAAQVAAASLMREYLNAPKRASRLYRSALSARPGGALNLEALQGLALSHQDLGDIRRERATLRALVAKHPLTPAARRAEARLRELAAAGP